MIWGVLRGRPFPLRACKVGGGERVLHTLRGHNSSNVYSNWMNFSTETLCWPKITLKSLTNLTNHPEGVGGHPRVTTPTQKNKNFFLFLLIFLESIFNKKCRENIFESCNRLHMSSQAVKVGTSTNIAVTQGK